MEISTNTFIYLLNRFSYSKAIWFSEMFCLAILQFACKVNQKEVAKKRKRELIREQSMEIASTTMLAWNQSFLFPVVPQRW